MNSSEVLAVNGNALNTEHLTTPDANDQASPPQSEARIPSPTGHGTGGTRDGDAALAAFTVRIRHSEYRDCLVRADSQVAAIQRILAMGLDRAWLDGVDGDHDDFRIVTEP